MSRPWQAGDIVERQIEPDTRDGFATQTTAMVSAVQVASSNRFDTVRWVILGPWFEYKTQQQLEGLGWRLVEPKVLIPPGTPTHREGHPRT